LIQDLALRQITRQPMVNFLKLGRSFFIMGMLAEMNVLRKKAAGSNPDEGRCILRKRMGRAGHQLRQAGNQICVA